MARYIDADLLHIRMEDLYEHRIEMKNFSADGAVADCLDLLDNAPTADVAEVKHGEWKKPQFSGRRGFYSVKDFVCNKCGGAFGVEQGNLLMNYCPNCGAKMDGGKVE